MATARAPGAGAGRSMRFFGLTDAILSLTKPVRAATIGKHLYSTGLSAGDALNGLIKWPIRGNLMKIQTGSRLVMTGDSITDVGRLRPVGDGAYGELGRGYVAFIDAMLRAAQPGEPVHVVNTGVGGDTTRLLRKRWQADVLDLKPDWLSIMIGANDVWRQFDHPYTPSEHVLIDEFEANLRWMIEKTQPGLNGLVLMTPYFVEPCRTDAMRAMMDQYGDVVRRLAGECGAILVDTQAAFDAALVHVHAMSFSFDRVHPNDAGHMLLARAFLSAVGFAG